ERVIVAAALAVLVGLACIAAGKLGLGMIANFLSKPVLMGFLAGVGLDLIVGQLGKFTGLKLAGGFLSAIFDLLRRFPESHLRGLLVGLGLLAILRALRRWAPKIPGPLVAVGLALVLSLALGLGPRGVKLVGAIPQAVPQPTLPWPRGLPIEDLILD